MMYQMYHSARKATSPIQVILKTAHDIAESEKNPLRKTIFGRMFKASVELPYNMIKPYGKRDFDLHKLLPSEFDHTNITETIEIDKPFGNLHKFHLDNKPSEEKPKVLIVAALSGHYATLLRDMNASFLVDYDVYVTDWKNARDVPLADGSFGFDDYVTYIMDFMEAMGPDTHVLATCQSCPQALIAAALLSEQKAAHKPKTLTLMAGPVDIRVNGDQSAISGILKYTPLKLINMAAIKTVPKGFAGEGRRVYPGFMQLSGFMTVNIFTHLRKHFHFGKNIIEGDELRADAHREFYEEYYTVLDASEEFYIETLEKVFYDQQIAKGTYEYKGKIVDFGAVTDIPLLTLEGANDEFCPPGQTAAAHTICHNLPDKLRAQHVMGGVGHYGVFAGSSYRKNIHPVIEKHFEKANKKASKKAK